MNQSLRRLALLASVDVTVLPGIGGQVATALAKLNITSVLDLVMFYPRRYADRTNCVKIADLHAGDAATVRASVRSSQLRRLRGGKSMVQVVVEGDDGGELGVTFFNQPWRANQLSAGTEIVLYGKAEPYRSKLQMTNPRLDVVGMRDARETGRIVPIYPQSEKSRVASYQLARYIEHALAYSDEHDAFADPLSQERCAALGLVSRREAFHGIHHPTSNEEQQAARRRLAFDELWRLQVVLLMRKRAAQASSRGIRHTIVPKDRDGGLVDSFVKGLSFPLTSAQRRAIGEIAADLVSEYPMHRLLQGDVGSGKTVVALATLLYAVQGGYQGAFMVPTEVLAEQHFLSATTLLSGLEVHDAARLTGTRPVTTALLTSKTPAAERARLTAELAAGTVDLLIGTHALLTEDVHFSSLGVVVIDEQHRFGVDQRAALREKGSATGNQDPDLLVMTATPIPRTAAMTVYGDLDSSVLDEMPLGRASIATRRLDEAEDRDVAFAAVRDEVEKGHAAYIVCPLVRPGGEREEGDDDTALDEVSDDGALPIVVAKSPRQLHAATEEFEVLRNGALADLRVGLLHGQLSAKDKQSVMEKFRAGTIDVLVATTVIEVGVDVARATVMVIEDADRFGIAQLHQLRGRVGRAELSSYCYLIAPESTAVGEERLSALVSSTDGFLLAEVDFDLRGEGTVLGAAQKGRNDLRLASLRRDRDLVDLARVVAKDVVDTDPTLERHPTFAEELRVFIDETEAQYLLRS